MVLPNARPDIPLSPLSPTTQSHFQHFPPATPYFNPTAHSTTYLPITTLPRIPKPDTEDALLAHTLSTPTTIPYWQSFYLPRSSPALTHPPPHTSTSEAAGPIGELHILLTLGSALNGKANVIHGGLLGVLFDELITGLANLHREEGTNGYTAVLKVDFRRPVSSPGCYLMRGWFEGRSGGRKAWVRGEMVGWDIGEGAAGGKGREGREVVLAEAEGLVVDVREGAKL